MFAQDQKSKLNFVEDELTAMVDEIEARQHILSSELIASWES